MNLIHINKYCKLDNMGKQLLTEAANRLKLSGRKYHQTIKIARTIADLNHQDNIHHQDIAEALQYRRKV